MPGATKPNKGLKLAKTPFIDKNTAIVAFEESKRWLTNYWDPIDELDRIARNRPSTKIPQGLPKITDGTVASIVQEDPKRIIQTEPTGIVECKEYPEYAKMADIELRDRIIPLTRVNGTYLQKSWNMLGKAATHGRSTSYSFLTVFNGKVTVDYVIPYIKDVITEKGKVYAPDCNIRYMRAWYQKRDLQAIINKEKMLKEKNPSYVSDWNLEDLAELIEAGASAKPADQQTPAEKERGGDTGGYELIHAFQTGKEAEFYTFAPRFKQGKPIRTKVNKDPRGAMPFNDLYWNIDLSNPLGRGAVEMSAGVQNLMDQKLQMNQFLSTMLMGPPLKKWGNVDETTLTFTPNAIWDMGPNKQSGDVEPYQVTNDAIRSFIPDMQFLQSKIYNLNNSQDTSIGAASGDVNQSKTQAGVEAQQQRLGVSDNYVRKQYEAWFEGNAETAINMLFAEMTGEEKTPLDKNDMKEFASTPAMQYVQGNLLTIPYREINKVVFHFKVNPDSSEVKENSENVDKLKETLTLAAGIQNPQIQEKIPALFKVLVKEIGAEGVDEIFPEDQTDESGQPMQPQQPQITPEMVQQIVMETVQPMMEEIQAKQPQQDSPEERLIKSIGLKFNDLPENARQKVLADLGLESDEQTPADHKKDLEAFNAMGNAHGQLESAETAKMSAQNQPAGSPPQEGQNPTEAEGAGESDLPALDAPLSQEEDQIVAELTRRRFNENDIEQAIVMLRSGRNANEVMQLLGAKQA